MNDDYNSRLTTIKNPEMKKNKELVQPFKIQFERSDMNGYGPASKEVVQVGTDNKTFRDSIRQSGNG